MKTTPKLIEGKDYYIENGLFVLSAQYLRARGYCCGSGCRHCPYPVKKASIKEGQSSQT